MKKSLLCCILFFILTTVLAGCGTPPAAPAVTETEVGSTPTVSEPSSVSTASPTPDLCSLPQLEQEVQKVHKHMREFDDAAILASNMPREQLSGSIADLQRIRREAEDELIPDCLTTLKTYQVEHMNSVINTLLAFMRTNNPQAIGDCSNPDNNPEVAAICQSIAVAREQHDEYIVELARLLGLTAVAATAPPAPLETPTP